MALGIQRNVPDIVKEIKETVRFRYSYFCDLSWSSVNGACKRSRHPQMKYGHRGGNHPVKDLEDKPCHISSQNHGYVVDTDNLDPNVAIPAFVNVNDGTNEGLKVCWKNIFTVQFHPKHVLDRRTAVTCLIDFWI